MYAQFFHFIIVVLWHCSFLQGAIQIYPSSGQYFGGNIINPTITCQPSESCGDTIKWFFGQNQIDTSLSKYSTSVNILNYYQILTVNNADVDDEGAYYCQCVFSGLAINSPQSSMIYTNPVSFNTPNNINYDYFIYDNITIVCDIQDYVEFQWQFSDNSVIPSNNGKFQYIGTNLLIKSLSLSDSGAYYCLANNQVTTIEKLRANLNVFMKPIVNISSTGTASMYIQPGEAVLISCNASGLPLPNIVWEINGSTLTIDNKTETDINDYTKGSTVVINNFSLIDDGIYRCTGQNSNGSSSASISLMSTVQANAFFKVYTIADSHNSINISWNITGIYSDMINISWSSDQHHGYELVLSNTSLVRLTDLYPETIYTINATVIGTEFLDIVNETTLTFVLNESPTKSIEFLSISTSIYTSKIDYTTYQLPSYSLTVTILPTNSQVTDAQDSTDQPFLGLSIVIMIVVFSTLFLVMMIIVVMMSYYLVRYKKRNETLTEAEFIFRQQQSSRNVVLDAITHNPVQSINSRIDNGPRITMTTEPACENLEEINFVTNNVLPVQTMNCPAYNTIPAVTPMTNQASNNIL